MRKRIFAVGFLAAAPAGIAKDVDVRRPEGESVKDAVVAFALGLVVFGTGLGGDDVAHGVDDGGIPCSGHANGLGENGCVSGASHTVKRFVPGLIVGNAEARDGSGPVFKLRSFFVERHEADQVMGSFAGREFCVEVGSLLSRGMRSEQNKDEQREKKGAAKWHADVPPGASCNKVRDTVG